MTHTLSPGVVAQVLGSILAADRMNGGPVLTIRGQTEDGTPCDVDYASGRIARICVRMRAGPDLLFTAVELGEQRLVDLRAFVLARAEVVA